MFKTCVSFSKKRGLWKIILEIMYFCGNKKKSAAFSTKHYYIFANFYFAHCPQNCTIDANIYLWIKAPQSLQNTFLIPWRPTFPVTEHVNNEEIKVRLRLMSGLGSYFAKWAIKLHGHQIRLMRLGWISFEIANASWLLLFSKIWSNYMASYSYFESLVVATFYPYTCFFDGW